MDVRDSWSVCHQREWSGHAVLFLLLLIIHIEVKVEVSKVCGYVLSELLHASPVLLGGTACSLGTVDKSADATYLQHLILFGWCHIFQYLGQQTCSHAFLYGLQHLEGVGDGWLAYAHDIAGLHRSAGLQLCSSHAHLSLAACCCGQGACLEDTCRP